jgi:lysophospholipase L1-like esterase
MATTTSKLALIKPATSENYDVGVFNTNADLIDNFATTIDNALKDRENSHRFVKRLSHVLKRGLEPLCISTLGDSTGNNIAEWFGLTMSWLAPYFHNYTFNYKLWADTTQSYNSIFTKLQEGANGDAYALFSNTSGRYIATPHNASFAITGDIDLRAKVALDDWTPSTAAYLINRLGSAGSRGYVLYIDSAGKIALYFSPNGTDLVLKVSTVAVPANDGEAIWVRATLDVDNGAGGYDIKFYTSTNYPNGAGGTWTQLGTTVTTAGTTSINANNVILELGGRSSGTSNFWGGKLYEVEIRNGIDGKVVANPDLGMAFPSMATTFKDTEGNVYTRYGATTFGNGSPAVLILNGSHPGANISYILDETRFELQTPIEPNMIFLNYGHNDVPTGYEANVNSLYTKLITKYPNVSVVLVTQNPQISPRTEQQIYDHWLTQKTIVDVFSKNNLALVDTYRAFIETGDIPSYMNVDGVHPATATGSVLQKDVAVKFLAGVV